MLNQLLDVLSPVQQADQSFLAQNMHPRAMRVYGGQVLGQALRVAAATVDKDRPVHSQHAYFLRPGNPREEIVFEVEHALDGGSLSSRRVVALQQGKPILVCSVSFMLDGEGERFQQAMPDLPPPESLPNERERSIADNSFNEDFMILTGEDLDVRLLDPVDWKQPVARKPVFHAWLKTRGPIEDQPGLHEALLAYMSDSLLIDACLIANGQSFLQDDLQVASLDHALWFHQAFRADEWLLHTVEAECVMGGRGLSRGRFFTRSGELVASSVQQGLMRYR